MSPHDDYGFRDWASAITPDVTYEVARSAALNIVRTAIRLDYVEDLPVVFAALGITRLLQEEKLSSEKVL